MRIVLDLKRGADPDAAMSFLYRKTRLQTRFSVNMTALFPVAGSLVPQPRKKGLLEVLKAFLDFRFSITERRLQFDLKRLRERIHILEAFEMLFDALDEAIGLIRESEGKSDARDRLRLRFEFDHEQAEAILETKLYRLAKLEIDSIRLELGEKRQEASALDKMLGSKKLMWGLIRTELSQIADAYGDRRRSKITGPIELQSYSAEEYIVSEDSFVIVTSEGLFKRQKSYSDLSAIRVREGDEVKWLFPSRTTESLILFTDRGRAYTVRVYDIPQTTGYGEHLQTRFEFADGETVVGAISTDPRCLPEIVALEEETEPPDIQLEEGSPSTEGETVEAEEGQPEASGEKQQQKGPMLLGITRGGRCLRFDLSPFSERSTVNGRRYMKLNQKVKNDGVVRVLISSGNEIVSLATKQGRCLLFPIDQVNYLSSAGMGVLAIKLAARDSVIGFALSSHRMEGLEVETSRGRREVLRPNKFKVTRRGGKGREIIKRGDLTQAIFPVIEIICESQEEDAPMEGVGESAGFEANGENEDMIEGSLQTESPEEEEENNSEDNDAQGTLFDTLKKDKKTVE
jgi:DNA gyrase subunit A